MGAAEELGARAMASAVRILVVGGPPGAAAGALDHIRGLEDRWTRFSPTSDTTRLNTAGGDPVVVAATTLVLVTALVEGWRLTGGRFDPSTLPALVAAGYGASLDDPTRTTALPPDAAVGTDLARIEVDPGASTVQLPPGTVLDPGGLGKGLAADLTVERLLADGAAGALVSIGGDLAVAGTPPSGDSWSVAVDDPRRPARPLLALLVDGGGIATSSTLSRRIGPAGRDHHLIDPETGRPVVTDIASATVVAPTAWKAEALATATLVGGSSEAVASMEGHGVDGVVVTLDGRLLATAAATVPCPREVRR